MKNLKLITLFIFISFGISAQNYTTEKEEKITQENLIYLNSTKTNLNNLTPVNSVYILQQGQYNEVDVALNSNDSEVTVSQLGNENEVDLKIEALRIRAKITQTGNYNIFKDYSFIPQSNYHSQINQTGNNQKIYVSGSNSLSKNLKINLTGNDKTIFVNNYQ